MKLTERLLRRVVRLAADNMGDPLRATERKKNEELTVCGHWDMDDRFYLDEVRLRRNGQYRLLPREEAQHLIREEIKRTLRNVRPMPETGGTRIHSI